MALQTEISAKVKAQYEAFPYPDYPLGLPLRAQEAYASHSLFAARLLEQQGVVPALRREAAPRVLIAGCGDTYPYLATFWEPRSHRVTAMDLSAGNLRRARMRCLPRLRGLDWRLGNLEDPDCLLPSGLSHFDSYGVLHHLSNPARAFQRLGGLLLPGGTARIMVYNSAARTWLRHLQRALALLGLSAAHREDIARARRLLESVSAISPALRERFAPMRSGAFANDSRFVDTFLHAREARLGLDYWLAAAAAAGLRVIGLQDRYGELDDLPNPLLAAPAAGPLRERLADRRFENNLELFLARPGPAVTESIHQVTCTIPSLQAFRSPPPAWFSYEETRSLPWLARRRLWIRFLRGLCGRREGTADAWAGRLPPESLQRLGRLGALFPDDFASGELQGLLLRPRHESMEPPEFAVPEALSGNRQLRDQVEALLREKKRPPGVLEPVMNRLQAAQAP